MRCSARSPRTCSAPCSATASRCTTRAGPPRCRSSSGSGAATTCCPCCTCWRSTRPAPSRCARTTASPSPSWSRRDSSAPAGPGPRSTGCASACRATGSRRSRSAPSAARTSSRARARDGPPSPSPAGPRRPRIWTAARWSRARCGPGCAHPPSAPRRWICWGRRMSICCWASRTSWATAGRTPRPTHRAWAGPSTPRARWMTATPGGPRCRSSPHISPACAPRCAWARRAPRWRCTCPTPMCAPPAAAATTCGPPAAPTSASSCPPRSAARATTSTCSTTTPSPRSTPRPIPWSCCRA